MWSRGLTPRDFGRQNLRDLLMHVFEYNQSTAAVLVVFYFLHFYPVTLETRNSYLLPPPLPPDLFFSCPVLSSPQLCDSFCLTIQLRLYWITNFLPPLISKVQGELMFLWVALSLKQSVKKIKRLLFRLLLWLLMARWPLLLRYFLFEGTPTFSCSSAWNQLL